MGELATALVLVAALVVAGTVALAALLLTARREREHAVEIDRWSQKVMAVNYADYVNGRAALVEVGDLPPGAGPAPEERGRPRNGAQAPALTPEQVEALHDQAVMDLEDAMARRKS